MATEYRIFKGSAAGGPVDYTTVVATVSGTSYAAAALGLGTTTKFAVRTHDTVTGLEEQNVDAVVSIAVGAAGADVTGVPLPPQGLRAVAGVGGAAAVEWSYPYPVAARRPVGFRVYAATPSILYTPVAVTVPFVTVGPYRAALTGLTLGSSYKVAVRAYNASGEETNAVVVTLAVPAAGPAGVDALAVTAVP